jgi:rhamnosyl/mannosyltransferase
VLQIGKYYPPVDGGIEDHVQAVVSGLAPRYKVTVLVFNTDRRTVEEQRDGARIVRVGSLGRVLSTEMAPSYPGWFRRLRDSDIVHLHTPNPLGELACLSLPRRARLIITYHSDVVRQKLLAGANRIVLHRLMQRADRVIAFTERYLRSSPVLSRYPEKAAIIPHGVDLAAYQATAAIDERVAALQARFGPRIVLFVGRLVYYKGIEHLLRAIPNVPGAHLLIAGDGPLRGELERQAAALGLGSTVTFLGRISHDEKVACYRASRVLVLPATHRSEAFGLVQVEAFACGVPVVSTDIDSGVPFVNQHGVTGQVVPPADSGALATALGELLADEQRRREMGLAARRRGEELFSRGVMLRDLLALYEGLARPVADGASLSPESPLRAAAGRREAR